MTLGLKKDFEPEAITDGMPAQCSAAGSNQNPLGFGQDIRNPAKVSTICKNDMFAGIMNGTIGRYRFKEKIEAYRKNPAQKALKLSLPWFCGAIFKGKRAKQNIQSCHYVIMDLDDIQAEREELEQIKQDAFQKLDASLIMAFLSPGLGLKLVYELKRSVNEREFNAVWGYLADELEKKLNLKADLGAKSIAQACFFSYDPSARIRNCVLPLEISPIIDKEHQNTCFHKPYTIYSGSAKPFEQQRNRWIAEDIVGYMLLIPTIAYCDWIKMAMALKNSLGELGLAIFLKFAHHPGYNDSEKSLLRVWNSLKKLTSPGFGTLVYTAQKYGWDNIKAYKTYRRDAI